MGGRFTLSDDSHGVGQVGLNYDKVLACIEKAGIIELVHLTLATESRRSQDDRFPKVHWSTMSVTDLKAHAFWTS